MRKLADPRMLLRESIATRALHLKWSSVKFRLSTVLIPSSSDKCNEGVNESRRVLRSEHLQASAHAGSAFRHPGYATAQFKTCWVREVSRHARQSVAA